MFTRRCEGEYKRNFFLSGEKIRNADKASAKGLRALSRSLI